MKTCRIILFSDNGEIIERRSKFRRNGKMRYCFKRQATEKGRKRGRKVKYEVTTKNGSDGKLKCWKGHGSDLDR